MFQEHIKTFVHKLTNLPKSLSQRPAGSRKKFLLIMLIPVLAVLAFFGQSGCAVVLDGEVLAVAADRETAKAAVDEYMNLLEQTGGMPAALKNDIKYRPTWKRQSVSDKTEIQRLLAGKLGKQRATGIFADGKMIAAVKDSSSGKKVLETLLNTYGNQGNGDVSFKQQVELKPVAAGGAELLSVEEAVERIRFGGTEPRTYTVKEGDTLWDVAAAVHLPVEELLQANPDLKPETMQIGQEIKISRTSPLVDVLTTYTDTRREEILYRVQEKVSPNLFLGERKLVQRGQPGQREVVYSITLENGVEKNKKVLSEKVLKEPVPQIIAKGNRKLLAFRGGNGRLAYPTVGGIVSPFGARWGRTHEGVDIGANYGSPVVAAEAGRVLRAGYRGGYGLCIDIAHGNGVVTRYAHLSSAAVKAGQRVERGQFIGRAGSSGNSTGPHLHFEVLVNGVPKDPALFI